MLSKFDEIRFAGTIINANASIADTEGPQA